MKVEIISPSLVLVAIIFNDVYGERPQKVLRKISAAFGETIWDCRKEVIFSMDIIEEFQQYWKPEYVFRNPELGCVAVCVLLKLRLVDQNNMVLENNAIGFAKANYADERTARQLLRYWLQCHQSSETNATLALRRRPCAVGLALAKCFRRAVLHHHLEPHLTDLYDDDNDFND